VGHVVRCRENAWRMHTELLGKFLVGVTRKVPKWDELFPMHDWEVRFYDKLLFNL